MAEIYRCLNYKTPAIARASKRTRALDAMVQPYSIRETGETSLQVNPAVVIGKPLPVGPLQLKVLPPCLKCGAKKIEHETLHFCCGDGDIRIASNEYPPELERLFTSDDEDAVHFRKYARLGGPKFLQLYFCDGQCEAANRTKCFLEVRDDIIEILMRVTKDNPYARFFRSLKEINVSEDTQIVINQHAVLDQRMFNAPTSNEVAAIWTDSTGSSKSEGSYICVSGRSDDIHRIYHYYGCYDPLQYPLLFPYGDCGWAQGMCKNYRDKQQHGSAAVDPVHSCSVNTEEDLLAAEALRASENSGTSERHISPRQYYAYKLQNHPHNMLLRAGRCFQQYIVDMYIKIENTRLDFFRRNQQTIRADLYQGILDSVEGGETNAINVGRRVILSPTFIGGPRDMKRPYLNAMSLVQRFGKPDLFVTMTCNAKWPEITAELADRELAENRPDLITRVFRSKLISLKHEIMKKHVFGEFEAMIYVIEFQKRGLPHAHFLIILKGEYKVKSPSDFDKFVCAEIPVECGNLWKIVLAHMMHGPCGLRNPSCGCMKKQADGSIACNYNYPRAFLSETTNNEDGFPMYRRRNTGESVRIWGANLDNRWVIPYNPYLSKNFDCHLNVEVCSTIHAVKYLYKYVYKGHDRVSFSVAGQQDAALDEIKNFQSCRWVSPCEATWRIFGLDLFEMHPPVQLLPVHLPNMQTVVVNPNERLDTVVQNDKRSRTALTEFFRLNAATPGGTGHLYSEMTEHFRWDNGKKAWFQRQNKRIVVGRLAFVAPGEGERFFLRLLLINIRSPKSFEDLLTVKGQVCCTFQEVAIKRGLMEADGAVVACLEEASEVQIPVAMRQLFATIQTVYGYAFTVR
ncbi:uncharacterized protein LOC110715140 [Chenopodium quinoa]|uniref:uncharacterized protein LOC110715140 n=1 Tax=Chenopodium quinoa TaxID=63459 RepID=UPI000B786364|nr:uncharacterized protein LOC110715140 [Chenopodium quinoa]